MAHDPLIGRPMIGRPNPKLRQVMPQQKFMLALVAWGFAVLVIILFYWPSLRQ